MRLTGIGYQTFTEDLDLEHFSYHLIAPQGKSYLNIYKAIC